MFSLCEYILICFIDVNSYITGENPSSLFIHGINKCDLFGFQEVFVASVHNEMIVIRYMSPEVYFTSLITVVISGGGVRTETPKFHFAI